MARTILSENQYEKKFITTAKPNATTMPDRPPRKPPIRRNSPVRSPRSRVLFTVLAICLLPRRPGHPTFRTRSVVSLGSLADGSGSVKRGRALGNGPEHGRGAAFPLTLPEGAPILRSARKLLDFPG